MPTNDFLPFATNSAANVMSQADYAALAARVNGFSSGTARSEQLNKAWRQSSVIAAVLAQFIVNNTGNDVLDDGDQYSILANLQLAIEAVAAGGVAGAGYLIDSNNLSDVVDAAEARLNLDLGTAATVDAQTSKTDDTLGRVLLTGAYGFGQGGIVIPDGTDLNTITAAGIYRVNTGPNVPAGGEHAPMLVMVGQDTLAQMIIGNQSGTVFTRGCVTSGAGFGSWVTNWNSSNFNPDAPPTNPLFGFPIGVPVSWPTAVVPAGCVAMAGQAFSATTYPDLALVYPALILPDMRGEWIRGHDGGRGIDSGRVLLSWQGSMLESHTHTMPRAHNDDVGNGSPNVTTANGLNGATAASNPTGGSETRPRNIAFNFICRAQ